jgi:hypothetical protein
MSKTLLEITEQMAEAIREWNRAKSEREEWQPVPGVVPPGKYLDNARQANVMLAKALEEYDDFQQLSSYDESWDDVVRSLEELYQRWATNDIKETVTAAFRRLMEAYDKWLD